MTQQDIDNINFSKAKILVIGDVILDEFIYGKVNRMSPECPVPVLEQEEVKKYLGGAANVVLNIQALDASVNICSVIGKDKNGLELVNILKENNINTEFIFMSKNRKTSKKTRAVNNETQLLRIDHEDTHELEKEEFNALCKSINKAIAQNTPDVIVIQDYNKGVINKNTIGFIKKIAKEKEIKVCVDPKYDNFTEYADTFLFKPNLKEFSTYLNKDLKNVNTEELVVEMLKFQKKYNINYFLLTLGEKGMLISNIDLEKSEFVSVQPLYKAFVSGAGDTVISVAACCFALDIDYTNVLAIANIAGRLACSKKGIATIKRKELIREVKIVLAQ